MGGAVKWAWRRMTQSTIVSIAAETIVFASAAVLARVEWHPPDFQNNVVHRGVTLYEPV